MNDLLKDFKIQPTKLRGENMEEIQKIINKLSNRKQETLLQGLRECQLKNIEHVFITREEYIDKILNYINDLQQELTNQKAIEKEHQRMNGELREEIKELKEVNTYSKRNLFKMNKERLEANLKLVNENERLKKHLEVPETCNLKTLVDYADYYKDLDKAQILADTYIDYCAYVNLAHRYSELETQLKELKKSNGINDWQRQVNLKNYMDTIHIIDELEKWLEEEMNIYDEARKMHEEYSVPEERCNAKYHTTLKVLNKLQELKCDKNEQ